MRNNGTDINDQFLDGIRKDVWNAFVDERLTEQAIKDLKIKVSDEDLLFYLQMILHKKLNNYSHPMDNSIRQPTIMRFYSWFYGLDPNRKLDEKFLEPRLELQQRLNSSVTVTENDVRRVY